MEYSKTQFLMGTDITITIFSKTNSIEDIYNGLGIFYSLEKEFSRFLDNSDLSILNNKKELEVSNRFIDILNKSKNIYLDSSNYFNPLINLNNIGYSNDFKKGFFEKKDIKVDLNFENISIIGNFVSLKENQNLDFGGIVKGYGVDLVVYFLKNKGYNDFIRNAGGDIYIGGNNGKGNIPVVAIDNPFNPKDIFATLELKDKSISTSGTYKRKWNIDGKDFHHILNPEINANNNEIISISLIADKCFISDTYATTCIAMGINKSLEFLEKYNIDGIIIGSDGNIYKTKGIERYNFSII